ncbi:hypothetical protein PS2_124 [Serratia phage PS2]|uniref:Uncharacterized protein n=1 Tax=Serratia phage PS2 TaxID=1481112 RepID=A0A023W535_9CAUD|nr:hypothetical protein FF83_gp124 [Serratia phage PS2]AHY25370.1 hypothetical protein PS2_124 [Serratia phage PS2]
MKKLTHLYSALMHAHKDRVISMEEDQKYFHHMSPAMIFQEYCTLRIDAGRQSGKSTAAIDFAHDWINDGGDVILIGYKSTYNREFVARLKNLWLYRNSFDLPEWHDVKKRIHEFAGIRSFLGMDSRFRGIRLGRVLVLIDEPMDRLPEIRKIYEKYHQDVSPATSRTNYQLPVFMVLGCQ